jgi:hypothetical protein
MFEWDFEFQIRRFVYRVETCIALPIYILCTMNEDADLEPKSNRKEFYKWLFLCQKGSYSGKKSHLYARIIQIQLLRQSTKVVHLDKALSEVAPTYAQALLMPPQICWRVFFTGPLYAAKISFPSDAR